MTSLIPSLNRNEAVVHELRVKRFVACLCPGGRRRKFKRVLRQMVCQTWSVRRVRFCGEPQPYTRLYPTPPLVISTSTRRAAS